MEADATYLRAVISATLLPIIFVDYRQPTLGKSRCSFIVHVYFVQSLPRSNPRNLHVPHFTAFMPRL